MDSNEEKITTKLEDNIIDIPVPDTMPETEIYQQVTPITEVKAEEHTIEEKNNNLMIEKQDMEEKVTGKSLTPLIIVFTIFIISIIGLPYIDDLIAMINPKSAEEEFIPAPPISTPIPTPTVNPTPTPSISPTIIPANIIDELTQ